MGKLSRRDMEELREACSYDCGYTDTEEVVKDITAQVLEELIRIQHMEMRLGW